jgi:integrase
MHSSTYRFEFFDGVYWCINAVTNAKSMLGPDEARARRRFQEIIEPVARVGTVGSLINWYMAEIAPEKRPRTYQDNQYEIKELNRAFKDINIRELRPHHVATFRDERGASAPTRANREIALLSTIFSKALERGWVDINPCRGVKKITERKRDRYISDHEFQTVYKACPKHLKRFMILACTTAQRPADIIKLGRHNIAITHSGNKTIQVLRLSQEKTATAVDIVIAGRLKSLIDECMEDPADIKPFVYSPRTRGTVDYHRLCRRFKAITQKVGVQNFKLYDLKGKAATDMYKSGVPLEKIQSLLGHTSVLTTERYIKSKLSEIAMPNVNDPLARRRTTSRKSPTKARHAHQGSMTQSQFDIFLALVSGDHELPHPALHDFLVRAKTPLEIRATHDIDITNFLSKLDPLMKRFLRIKAALQDTPGEAIN